MLNELATEWVAALRSGKYEQGEGVLKRIIRDDEFEYCCLGVLCELALQKGIITTQRLKDRKDYFLFEEGSGLVPPESVIKAAGLKSTHELISMNDSQHRTFEEIATHLESEPEDLFESGTIKVDENGE